MALKLGSGTGRRLAVIEEALGIRGRSRDREASTAAREAERLVVVAEAEVTFDEAIQPRTELAREWSEALVPYSAAVRRLQDAAVTLRGIAERDGSLLDRQLVARDRGAHRPSPPGRLAGPGDAVELVAMQLVELQDVAQ
jgi:hypothetical protein